MYQKYFKRFLDVNLSLILLLILAPLILIIFLLIRLMLGGPSFFIQKRVGLNEKQFNLYKFRTMTNARDEQGNLLPDDKRLNKFGLFLRNTGLDEIPELINILKGDMSLIGPRPLLVRYLNEYSDYHKQRHRVRPGLTGLAQINGRNNSEWEKRLNYDVKYVKNITFFKDVMIILKTIKVLISFKGATPKNKVVMDEYKRNHND